MTKRKNRAMALKEESDSSKQTTPAASDSDASGYSSPPSKRQKIEKKKAPKTSEELCDQFGLTDVKLEYNEADYMNLTNYGLFVRMVRPQVSEANPKISPKKLQTIMEAKWTEFRESNPLVKKRREEEEKKKVSDMKKSEGERIKAEKRKEEEKKRKDVEKKQRKSQEKYKKNKEESDRDDTDDENGVEDEEDDDSMEESTQAKHGRQSVSFTMKIRLPGLASRRNSPKDKPASKNASEDDMDLSDEEPVRKKRGPKPKTPRSQKKKLVSPKVVVYQESEDDDDDKTDEDEEQDEEDEEEEEPVKKRKASPRAKVRPGRRRTMPVVYDESDEEDKSDEEESEVEQPVKKRSRGRKPKAQKKKLVSPEFVSDSDDQSDGDNDMRASSRQHKRNKQDAFGNSEDSMESMEAKKKPRKSTKRRKKLDSDNDDFNDNNEDGSSSEPVESDDDYDNEGKKKKKKRKPKKEKEMKPAIPGERKSDRKRKSNIELGLMTDRDFERLLNEEAEDKKVDRTERAHQKKKRQIAKEKRRIKEARKLKEQGKKGYWQAEGKDGEKKDGTQENGKEGGEDDDDDDHYWFCDICEDGGALMLCDGCPRSWHKECAKVEEIPEGEWKCPKCTGEMAATDDEDEAESGHDAWCKVCRDGGDVILCDTCPCVYHLHCVNPPLKECPEGEWKCPRCVMLETPLRGWVKSILTWKWSHQEKGFDEFDHTHSPDKRKKSVDESKEKQNSGNDKPNDNKNGNGNGNGNGTKRKPERMLFVKFRDYSYWECDWISELALEVFHPTTYSIFKRKWDQDEPPALEDGSSFGKRRHRDEAKTKEEDPFGLEDRYYKWGIKPEWLQIQRIINHEGSGKNKGYLVKWMDLPYEEATWEREQSLPEGLIDWDKHVEAYWSRRKRKLAEDNCKDSKNPKPKKSALKKKMEKQPDYIDATGCKLHPYQLEGLNWMRFSWAQDTNTILADEMGLGKTIQAISFLYSLWKEGYTKGPFLLSVPLSTLMNWEREFATWAPELYVVSYFGGKETRAVIREHEFSYKEGAFHSLVKAAKMRESHKVKFDVLLTSYEFVSMDMTTLKGIKWAVLVIDEAHRLKSNQSLFFRVLTDYRIGYRLLLTGTPLQNNLEELFNLLNFLQPEKFADMEDFLGDFSEISKEEQVQKLHDMLAPHMLRRMKIDVLKDIPPKTELIVRVELSPMQKKYYKHILTKNYEALNVKGHSRQTSLMNIMMDLRKCCNHPYLFPTADTEAPITASGHYEGSALIKASGKLELLSKMLHILKKQGHRILIFSQMTRMLDIMEDFLTYEGLGYERIDGSIMGKIRQESIDRFNSDGSDSFVFLLSTRAGGLGINLASADTVIIYDMDWNPHNDIQAFSRAHRIGQKNKVMIYRFVSRNTVEEKITQAAKKKMMLTELVIHRGMNKPSQGEEKVESLSKKEVNDILKFGAEDLFKDDSEGAVVYDDAAVEKLLDRSQEGEKSDEQEKEFGMNEYLRSFKVATYQLKEGTVEPEEEPEEPPEDPDQEDVPTPEEDREYWKRVLGPAYEEHRIRLMQEEEALAATLGKGKRQRRQVSRYTITYDDGGSDEKRNKKRIRDLEKEIIEEEEEEEEEEEQEVIDEDVKYMSDYEPESSESEDEWVEEAEKTGSTEEQANGEMTPEEAKKSREKRAKELKKSKPPEQLPPLIAKSATQVEVLGFTGRQRRAFLDAVMRYGMPPEDCYKSQWLVRDLRNKSEKVFKAYVSLFMRHLCEPISDDADKYADGVPREGLSRQHVLTRIGIMALIRKKVNEFEPRNGTHSLKEFSIVKEQVGVHNLSPAAAYWKKAMSSEQEEKDDNKGKGEVTGDKKNDKEDKAKEDEVKTGEKEGEADKKQGKDLKDDTKDEKEDEKMEDNQEEKKDEVKKEKQEDQKEEKDDDSKGEKDSVKESESKESEKLESGKTTSEEEKKKPDDMEVENKDSTKESEIKSEDKMEVDEQEDKSEEKAPSESQESLELKDSQKEATEGSVEAKESEKKDSSNKSNTGSVKEVDLETGEKVENMETDEQKEVQSSEKEESETQLKDSDENKSGDSSSKQSETVEHSEKENSPEEAEVREENKESKEENEECESNKDKTSEVDAKEKQADEKCETSEKDSDKKDEGKSVKGKGEGKEENGDGEVNANGSTKAEKDKTTKGKGDDKDKCGSEDTKKKGSHKKNSDDKGEDGKKGESQQEVIKKAIEDRRKKLAELRLRFYIADGGFTDLRNLWSYEESQLQPKREFETWHRLHDFWLLSGIITHGYRHWQDILNDSRFEILNRAFQSETDKLRKGAFLNRRFQLLEQALVIEEQLKKEVRSNASLKKLLPGFKEGTVPDEYALVDQLSDYLRRLIKDGQIPAGTDQSLVQLLIQIEGLVGDIRQATYTGMPATLAHSFPQKQGPVARPGVPQQQQQKSRTTVQVIAPTNRVHTTQSVKQMLNQKKSAKKDEAIICID